MTEQPAEPTPGPWEWSIHDHSMATLHGPDMMRDHVLAVGPCRACIERVKDGEWKWGRCTTPTETNAKLLATSWETAAERDRLKVVNERLVEALDNFMNYFGPEYDDELMPPDARRLFADARAAIAEARKP